jgi:drug/metabolite transporter (DMT)-like permease
VNSATATRFAPLLFVLLWSTGFIGAKYGLPHAEPLSFLLVRYLLVLSLMTLIALATRAPWPKDGRQWFHIGVAGLLVHAVYLGGVFIAISKGLPAGVTSLVVGIQPLLTAVGAGWLLNETVLKRQWAGLVLGFVGVAMVVSGKLGSGFGLAALWPALAALAGITAGTLYQKRFCPHFDWRTGAIAQFLPTADCHGRGGWPQRQLPRRLGARLHLRPFLAGAGAFTGRDLAAQHADPARQRGEPRQPVLPGAALHRPDRLFPVRREAGRHGPGRHGARRVGRVSGAEMKRTFMAMVATPDDEPVHPGPVEGSFGTPFSPRHARDERSC